MFFARRRRHHSLLHLVLLLLGVKCVCRRHQGACDEESREAHREKARLFRSKLKEAFAVWREEEAPQADPETQAENQG